MISNSTQQVFPRIRARFERLYGRDAEHCMLRLSMLLGRYGVGVEESSATRYRWSEGDAVLIAYADMVQAPDAAPLQVLQRFLAAHVKGAFNTLHLLPFFPSSSDDGFSVVDYRRVDAANGRWGDIQALGKDYRIACDLVLNHASRESEWFADFCAEIAPARDYFITPPRSADIAKVVRPRTHPLLTAVSTRTAMRHVWTTFSADQVDLNFADPDVLFEMFDIALFYVSNGVRVLRLDAIAYLWKRLGTPCIHLPETHEVVKLFRDLFEVIAPSVWILTETNVPHAENVSYFGAADEAHLVYQFSLPPLILASLLMGDATHLSNWAANLASPPAGCTFLNFTASHDGIGVRPLEGLVPADWPDRLVRHVKAQRGEVSLKSNSDGTQSVYELNISYFDALRGTADEAADLHIRRFLCSQLIALALQGIPAVYFHSLCATPNCYEEMARTGRARSINRRKYKEAELSGILSNSSSGASRVFCEYLRCLRVRSTLKALHPDAEQRVHQVDARLFVVERSDALSKSRVFAVSNCSAEVVQCTLPASPQAVLKDALSSRQVSADAPFALAAYETLWLVAS